MSGRHPQDTARAAVHQDSGHRLGAANPRQEGPPDLRLLPPALAAWGAAALALGMPGDLALYAAVGCAALAALLCLMAAVPLAGLGLPGALRGLGRRSRARAAPSTGDPVPPPANQEGAEPRPDRGVGPSPEPQGPPMPHVVPSGSGRRRQGGGSPPSRFRAVGRSSARTSPAGRTETGGSDTSSAVVGRTGGGSGAIGGRAGSRRTAISGQSAASGAGGASVPGTGVARADTGPRATGRPRTDIAPAEGADPDRAAMRPPGRLRPRVPDATRAPRPGRHRSLTSRNPEAIPETPPDESPHPTGKGGGRAPNAIAVAAVLLCAAAGAASAGLHTADLRRGPLPAIAERQGHAVIELSVTGDPWLARARDRAAPPSARPLILDGRATRVTAADGTVTTTRTPVRVIVRPGMPSHLREEWLALLPSTRLRVSGRLAEPRSTTDEFAAVLRTQGTAPESIGAPNALQRTAGGLRAGLRGATDGLTPDARALIPGLTVGDTARITADLQDAFEATDLTHLLAVSGSNLTVVLILLVGPPGRAGLAERGGLAPRLGITLRGTALTGAALTLAFVIVCRPEPSVLRAAACGAITLLALATGRRRSLLPALAAAVLLLVLYDPWLARNYGFLLSVLATGALLTLSPVWAEALRRRGMRPRLAEALAATAAAQAVCAPVVAVFAARVSLVAIPCNLAAELAVAPVTVLGFATLAIAAVHPSAAEPIARVAAWPAEWIATVARAGASLPGAQSSWPGGWTGGLLLLGTIVLCIVLAGKLARRPLAAACCALMLLLSIWRPAPLTRLFTGWPPATWSMAMCDVGQGDALVLAAGKGRAVVVDTGPDPEAVDRCLGELGVDSVPLVVLSHFHADHVRGLPGVLDGRAVAEVQTTGLREPAAQYAFVRRVTAAAGVPLTRAVAGEARAAGPLNWQVLWPPPESGTDPAPGPHAGPGSFPGGPALPGGTGSTPATATGSSGIPRPPRALPSPPETANDASVTLLVRIRNGPTALLLGDLEPPAQRGLLLAHPALPPVDVLKVAHHGSAHQDPGLLRAVRPRLALVSAGNGNTYGHPAPSTLGALRAGGARILRTDLDGLITVTGTGPSLRASVSRRRSRERAGRRGPTAPGGRPSVGPHLPFRGDPDQSWGSRCVVPGPRATLSPWTTTSAESVPTARSTQTPGHCANYSSGTCGAFRSRTSRSTWARRSFWTRRLCSPRSWSGSAAVSATNSTEPSPCCSAIWGSASPCSRRGSSGRTDGSAYRTTTWFSWWRRRTGPDAGSPTWGSGTTPTTHSPSTSGRSRPTPPGPFAWWRRRTTVTWTCCGTASPSSGWRPGRGTLRTSGPGHGGTAPRPVPTSPGPSSAPGSPPGAGSPSVVTPWSPRVTASVMNSRSAGTRPCSGRTASTSDSSWTGFPWNRTAPTAERPGRLRGLAPPMGC
jgi:competence protein ComEC